MHVFRIMDMPDRVIAFEGLPKKYVEGFEMIPAHGFPRHWKEWMGKSRKETKIPPERDPYNNGAVRRFDPIIEDDYFFYVVDSMLNPVVERWEALCAFVKDVIPVGVRITEKLGDMAKPLAPDKISQISLEPEDVVVIVIPEQYRDKPVLVTPETKAASAPIVAKETAKSPGEVFKCDQCPKEYEKPRALKMHVMAAHKKKEPVIATA